MTARWASCAGPQCPQLKIAKFNRPCRTWGWHTGQLAQLRQQGEWLHALDLATLDSKLLNSTEHARFGTSIQSIPAGSKYLIDITLGQTNFGNWQKSPLIPQLFPLISSEHLDSRVSLNFLNYTGVSGIEGNSWGIHNVFHWHFPQLHWFQKHFICIFHCRIHKSYLVHILLDEVAYSDTTHRVKQPH